MKDSAETNDKILGGRLQISQPRQGYRFSVDALLLADFARPKANERVLELGAGCGVVSLVIAVKSCPKEIVALEVDPAMARFAERNCESNRIANVRVLVGDLRDQHILGIEPQSFDWVVANPPYYAVGAGRQSPYPARRFARSETGATAGDFVKAAARYLRFGGKAAFVFVASRAIDLIAELRASRLEPKRLRFVHPRADRKASNVLIQAQKGAGTELAVEPPLILYEASGAYTAEARKILGLDE